jgi:HSP20 family molecular chaperone IbpA
MFYSCFFLFTEPSHLGEGKKLSAKWRRNKRNSRRFNIFRVFGKPKENDDIDKIQFKTQWTKRSVHRSKTRVPKMPLEGRAREPEPLVDVLEDNDEVIVVAEFAGFSKENIKTNVRNQRLTLSAEALDRKFHKSLNLPKRVIPATIRTAYKNGVLEIRFKKEIAKKAIGNVAG